MEAEKQMQVLAVEDQVRAMRDATDELARSLAEQIQSLKEAAAEAPSQKAAAEHEIQRLAGRPRRAAVGRHAEVLSPEDPAPAALRRAPH